MAISKQVLDELLGDREALGIMNEKKINVLAVVDGNARPLGILHDLLRAGVS